MTHDLKDFDQFIKRREGAAGAYVNGVGGAVAALSPRSLPATFFHPCGDVERGAEQMISRYERDAESFEPGGETNFEILQMAAGDGVAYRVGFQHATARLKGSSEAALMSLRVTEVFRREDGQWKQSTAMPPC